jgi:two-component system, cell cycle sensor histidine kinase and response regulator CckA
MEAAGPQAFAEERWRAFESARLRLARLRVAGGGALAGTVRRATEEAARVLEADRVGIWLFVDERRAIRCYDLFERATGAHSEGAILRASDFPAYFRTLEERRAIVAEDAREDPQTAELRAAYLEPLGIAAMLDVPVYREGQVVGVLCHEVKSARRFTSDECDFATSVADGIARQLEEAARRDAEARVEAQELHLAELRKMEALGRLSAGIAHDFKNVLTVVLGCVHEIERDAGVTPAIAAAAQDIGEAAERGAALARELLSFGRDEGRATAVVDAAAVVEGLAPMLRKSLQPRHSLRVSRIEPSGCVLMERAQLERVVLNLTLNAKDAMPGGGEVAIVIHDVPIDGGPGCYVVVEVDDAGVGMDAATRARVFEPFFTTKPQGRGTGIGMAVVYHVVERAGGFVHVESEPGVGTRVRVALPRVASRGEDAR